MEKKKILMLGAISAMKEIVLQAKASGLYVIVTDYLEDSPCKQYADESWMLSIDDVDGIVTRCKERQVDGVMNYCIDPAQKPYQKICEKLGFPCVAGFEQFDVMTNKDKFALYCQRYGVGTIPAQIYNRGGDLSGLGGLAYPVLIKPVDGRASKGVVVCSCAKNLKESLDESLSFSKQGRVLVQKYLSGKPEFCVKYFACDGEIFLTSMADVFTCHTEDGRRVYLGTQTYPSRYYAEYLETTHEKVIGMIKGLGIRNGATSFTGFYDSGEFRMFDPSLRMGGAQDWRIAAAASGIDISDALTHFAITGSMGDVQVLRRVDKAMATRWSALLYVDLLPGKIKLFEGVELASRVEGVVGYHQCHFVGDEICGLGTADNVAIRFIISCATKDGLVEAIREVQAVIQIEDDNGCSQIAPHFNVDMLW